MTKNMNGRMNKKLGISSKLIIIYLIIAVPMVVVIGYSYFTKYEARIERTLLQRTEIARMVASSFSLSIDRMGESMELIGKTVIENRYPNSRVASTLGHLLKDYPVDYAVYTDPSGTVVASTDGHLKGRNLSKREAFKAIINGYEAVGIEPVEHRQSVSGFYVTRVIKTDDGTVLGIVGSFVDVGKLNKALQINVPVGGINIVDSRGYLVYQNEYPTLAQKGSFWGNNGFIKEALAGRSATATDFIFPGNKKPRLVSEVPIEAFGWAAGSGVTAEDVLDPIKQELMQAAALTTIMLLIALAMSVAIARRIVKSLAQLVENAKSVGEGRLDEPIILKTGDEIEDVANSLNEARLNLKDYVEGLSNIAEAGSLLAGSLELERVKHTIIHSTKQLFGAVAAWVFVFNEKTGYLEPLFWAGPGAEEFLKVQLKPGESATGKVFLTGKPTIIPDIRVEPTVIHKELMARHDITSTVMLPLIIGENPIGVLGLFTPDTVNWMLGGREMEILETFATQVSIALENARLYEERIKAEEALAAERERLAVTLGSIGDGVIATDTTGNVVLLNKVAQDLTGWDQEEAAGRPLSEVLNIINEETREPAENPVEKALRTGLIVGLANHTALIAKDGTERSIADSCAPIRDKGGKVFGAVLVFRDVTEHSRLLDSLKNNEERFRSVAQTASDAIVSIDNKGSIIFWNKAAEVIFGYLADEAIGRSATLIMPERFRKTHQDSMNRLVSTGKPNILGEVVELTGLKKDGGEFPIELSLASWKTKEGSFFTGIIRDITERKRVEEALAAERERLAVTLGSIGDGVIATDTEAHVIMLNKVAEDLTGWTQEEAAGRPLGEVFTIVNEETREPAENPVSRALKTRLIVGLANHTVLIARDGSERSIADSCAPIRGRDGQVIGAVLVFRDVTEERRAEEERERLIEAERNIADILQTTMERTNAHIAYLDPQFNFIMANSTYIKASGHTGEELIGHNHFDLFPNEENEAIFKRGRDTGEPIEFKAKPFEYADQPWRGITYWDWTLTPVKDGTGQVIGLVLSLVDVTETIRAMQFSDALNEINTAIGSTLNLDEIMQIVVAEAAKAIGSEGSIITLYERNSWSVKHAYGAVPEEIIRSRVSANDAEASLLAVETRKPVIVDDAYNDERINRQSYQSYKRFGIRSSMAIPVLAKDAVIGAIHLHYYSAPISFTDAQVDFATKLSASVSFAFENARLYEAERNIADTLQEAILTLPESVEGIDFGTLYRSATETARVGGDFYDIFEIEPGKIGVVVGDVSGKGIKASAMTSLVKNVVRAYAQDDDSPASIMAKTNDLIVKSSPLANFVTLFFGILETKSGSLTYCSAGHPPAILVNPNRIAPLTSESPLIGAFQGLDYSDGKATLEAGDVLVLYTDGTIEARSTEDGLFGEERLVSFIEGLELRDAKQVPQLIFDHVASYADGQLLDDMAILAVSLSGGPEA